MMRFSYKAKQGLQKQVSGVLDADNEDQVVAKVMAMGLTPFDIECVQMKSKRKVHTSLFSFPFFSKKVSRHQVLLFTRHLSDLLDAGIPLLQALDSMESQTQNIVFQKMINQIISVVKDGGLFSVGLSRYASVFPPYYVNMVKSGETSGTLNVVMSRLADFFEKDHATRQQITTSLIYPSLILFVGSTTIFVLFTWVIPRITVIFEDLSETLPLSTMVLIAVSNFFAQFWGFMLLVLIMGGVFFIRFKSSEKGCFKIDQCKLRLPLFGPFIKEALISRFARTLATLLDNGVSIVSALSSVSEVFSNVVFKREIEALTQEVASGTSLSQAVKSKSCFSDTAIKLISIGEETGKMQQSLYKLAHYYERQTNAFVKRMTSLIEPVLILILGTVVAFVVMAMLLPMFQMNLIIN